ncbi:MAG: PhnD/SsuA/transferrin family substrate-binding protein, partial [Actinobacteria bacterium]|nr:PhnD/SsuA/transferrin family substrate-binding protein [Actinomycetota bacterium]
LVAEGEVDASAIDSQVLAIELRDHPELAVRLKVIDTLGPSTIQPVVAARYLPQEVRTSVQQVLFAMGDDPTARPALDRGFIERFVEVTDSTYDDIRSMLAAAEAVGYLVIR